MKTTNKQVSILLLGMLLLAPVAAQAHLFDAHVPGKPLSLQQCFALAGRQNLAVKAGEKAVEKARLMEGTAWDVDKTDIAFSQNPSTGGDTDNGFTFSQSIDFPTVYSSRRGQLKAETQAEKSRLGVINNQLRTDIATAYYTMLYHTHRLHILQRQDSILDRYCSVAEKRYKAGEARQLEFLTAERLCNENHLEMGNVKCEVENLQTELMALLNTSEPIVPAEKDLFAIAADAKGGYNYLQTADAQYQQDKLKALDKEIRCAKAAYAPSLSLALRTQCVITGWNPYHVDRSKFAEGNFFGFEVGVGVPLFYGATKAKVRAAKKDREVAELEMQQEQQQKERDYKLALNRLNTTLKRLQYYESNNDAQAEKIGRLSAMEYENGEITYVEYVSAIQETMDVLMKHADVVNEYNQAVIQMQGLTGAF